MSEVVAGDYRWFETVLDKLNAVTLDDIERVRIEYLRKQAEGDPVESVIATFDQQIAALLAAGPADGGGQCRCASHSACYRSDAVGNRW
jgi:ribosomal protein L12E/L44/L45/RPP1/RPP2